MKLADGTLSALVIGGFHPPYKLTPREEVLVVRYMIDLEDWRRAASESSPPGREK